MGCSLSPLKSSACRHLCFYGLLPYEFFCLSVRVCLPVCVAAGTASFYKQVAQALLSAALKPPLSKHHHLSARQLYQLLQAAAELGAAPTAGEMQLVQQFLSSSVV